MRGAHKIPLSRIQAVWSDAGLRTYQAKADALGVSIGTMHRWARFLDLPGRAGRDTPRKAFDAARILAVWADDSLATMAAKAAALGCGVSTLQRRRCELGLPPLASGPKPQFDRAVLKRLWREGVSSAEIAQLMGVRRDVIIYTANLMGLGRRGVAYRPKKTLSEVMEADLQVHLRRAAHIENAALWNAEMVDMVGGGRRRPPAPAPLFEGAI